MADKGIHRGPSFRGMLSPRTRDVTPPTPRAEQAPPTLAIAALPPGVLGQIIGQVGRDQFAQDFVYDVRSLSLVSRSTGTAVRCLADTELGKQIAAAWEQYGDGFDSDQRRRALAEAASRPARKKLLRKKPPLELKQLVRRYGVIRVDLCATDANRAVFQALLRWGSQLPCVAITINCGSTDSAYHPLLQDEQIVGHLNMVAALIETVGRHPHKSTTKIELNIYGTRVIRDAMAQPMEEAVDRLATAMIRAKVWCQLVVEDFPYELERALKDAELINVTEQCR